MHQHGTAKQHHRNREHQQEYKLSSSKVIVHNILTKEIARTRKIVAWIIQTPGIQEEKEQKEEKGNPKDQKEMGKGRQET